MRWLLPVLALFVAASPALARRPANADERTAIRAAFAAFVAMPGSPAAGDNKIVKVDVSTVDQTYAAAALASKSVGRATALLHKRKSGWKVIAFGSSLSCGAGPPRVLSDLAVPCAPTPSISNCGSLVRRPASLTIACGDGNYVLEGLKWSAWGGDAASASGTAKANDCKPNCAAGRFHSYPIKLTADRLTACKSSLRYQRLTIVYARARPAGIAARDVHTLSCRR